MLERAARIAFESAALAASAPNLAEALARRPGTCGAISLQRDTATRFEPGIKPRAGIAKQGTFEHAWKEGSAMKVRRAAGDIDRVRGRRFLISSTASDSHTWNLVFLQLLIEEHGHEVHNLGACVPVDHLIDQCLRLRPDVLVISSVNGHGRADGARAIQAIRATPSLERMRVVIGGKLSTRGRLLHEEVQSLLDHGFDAVFPADSGEEDFMFFLQNPASRSLQP
ncbi:cobalamin B12-binding domain-containing protein [Sorangium sp. So ce1097]|uniref:cobalamin B12-binding domain-containing protein n=1 Tax=Sorangium sp. So ce1097 TaxID=3133330 RepID=UPI003F604A11